ncbi:MAG TPA: hypothetical protein VFL63_06580 [Rhodanobacteraceae bacterium]|nr:hypothetical protein [Rhodanobacteraceae bacterium]
MDMQKATDDAISNLGDDRSGLSGAARAEYAPPVITRMDLAGVIAGTAGSQLDQSNFTISQHGS